MAPLAPLSKKPALRLVREAEGGAARDGEAAPESKTRPAFDDSELLRAVREGDHSAAAALHDRLRPQVDRTVRRLLGAGDPDHEDLVQATMIEIVLSVDRFRGDCSLDGWTATVAAHIVYKHIRRRRTERKIFGHVDPDVTPLAAPLSSGRAATARNLLRRVLDAIGRIDESKAWTYLLHDVCGYDLKEISQITGVSVAAAQTRLVRGRREVHERIAADPELAQRLTDMGEMP